jgi:hypothetical protein
MISTVSTATDNSMLCNEAPAQHISDSFSTKPLETQAIPRKQSMIMLFLDKVYAKISLAIDL